MLHSEDEQDQLDSDSYDTDISDASMSERSPSPSDPEADEESMRRWRASEPPGESFSDAEGANENGEWRFQIVGEEVDQNGDISLEVRWDDWKRADGTKTTWNTPQSINSDPWRIVQQKLRRATARDSFEIDVITTTDIHNTATYLRSQAYDEKLKRLAAQPQPDRLKEMAELQSKRQPHASVHTAGTSSQIPGTSSLSLSSRTNRRDSTRQKTEASLASSSATTTIRGSSKTSARSSVTLGSSFPNASSFATTPAPASSVSSFKSTPLTDVHHIFAEPSIIPMSAKGKGKRPVPISDDGDSIHPQPPPKSKPKTVTPSFRERPIVLLTPLKKIKRVVQSESEKSEDELEWSQPRASSSSSSHALRKSAARKPVSGPAARRLKLQNEWTKHAAKEGAAPIFFSNTVDEEAIPFLELNFCYLESTYKYAPGIVKPPDGFLTICSCASCYDATNCECQGDSRLVDENGSRIFAYTPSGSFSFKVPKGAEVIECNKLCKCLLYRCVNRVSQRPRDFPVEVFKTETRGWGARSLNDLKRGKVLGIYTGLVLRREDAHVLPQKEYCFDLDNDEGEGYQPDHDLFSVDSRVHGNWTRFINHSCSPNLQVYLVVHDTPPHTGMPYIAFVATEDIPSNTEFTFDYDPRSAEEQLALEEGHKKGKRKARRSSSIPDGMMPCHCGAPQCRGYLR